MAPASERRHDLDALRIFACYLLLLFHVGMVFNPAPFYHVRNAEVALPFLVLCGFISLWHMPLFFLLAGWSAAASLRGRGTLRFLRERGSKLAIPLVAGCVLLAPGIKYLELRSGLDLNHRGLRVSEELQESFRSTIGAELPRAEPFQESFTTFLPSFFTEFDRFSWSHLWFLAYLLTLSVVLLPLFAALLRRRGRPWSPSRFWVYAPLLPLVSIQLVLRERFPGPYNLYDDWASLSYFATFLLGGFVLYLQPALEDRLHEERGRALGIALVSMLLLLASVLGLVQWPPLLLAGVAVAGWCFVVALLGFARGRFTGRGRTFAYLKESAFPIYLLHQPAIVCLGFGVVALPLGIGAKFVLLLAGAAALTMGVYHFGVRRFGPVRVLAGMRPRRSGSGGIAGEPASALAPR